MNKRQLMKKLKALIEQSKEKHYSDESFYEAVDLLLKWIDDKDITKAFEELS